MPITPLTGRLAIVAMLIVLAAMASLTRGGAGQSAQTSNSASLDQSRTDMIAGCRDHGAPRSYCECVTDDVLERNGRNVARLRALEAEIGRLRPGAAPPRMLVTAARACAPD